MRHSRTGTATNVSATTGSFGAAISSPGTAKSLATPSTAPSASVRRGNERNDAIQASLETVYATLESLYYAFGDTDVYGVADFPDDASATAWSLIVNSTGAVSLNLVPLMTPEDIDAAAAKTPSYRSPGA